MRLVTITAMTVIFFHCFKNSPWPFKHQEGKCFCGNLEQCGNTDSSRDFFQATSWTLSHKDTHIFGVDSFIISALSPLLSYFLHFTHFSTFKIHFSGNGSNLTQKQNVYRCSCSYICSYIFCVPCVFGSLWKFIKFQSEKKLYL